MPPADPARNVWADLPPGDPARDAARERAGFGGVRRSELARPAGAVLGASVWELAPGATQGPYHFHHGGEELLIVLRGRPTLRGPEGERVLEEGEAVHFPRGPEGAHQVVNRTGEPVRYVVAAANAVPEVIEYPDSGKILALSRDLAAVHRLADDVGFWEGERPA